jgi:SAM-dependent methyltransferase
MMEKNEQILIKDIVEWDVENWKKALNFWGEKVSIFQGGLSCLELGAGRGGLSLWLALHGNDVICSDLISPKKHACELHQKYYLPGNITYEAIDATNIPYRDEFDIVIFKSILGGISRNHKDELKRKVIGEIYKALKPGGRLLFAENLSSSCFHRLFRKLFVRWGREWNYLKYGEISEMLSDFTHVDFFTTGFLGAWGRTERQRAFLAKLDNKILCVVPESKRYIVIGIAEKRAVYEKNF